MTPGGQLRLVELADRVFGYIQPDGSWFINNTGFVSGSRSVFAIDACATETRTRAFIEAIAGVTPLPIRTLVNTHSHPDHTNGNHLFSDATVIAQLDCRTAMAQGLPPIEAVWTPVDWGDIMPRLPEVTYLDRLDCYSDDLPIQLHYAGRTAHTAGDTLVWLPGPRVLFTGDLIFNGGTPFALTGSVQGWIDALEQVVRPLPFAILVPGHGEPCGVEAVETALDYLRFIQQVARDGRAAGVAPLEAARQTDLGRFTDLLDPERLVGNLHRAYHELGSPLDLVQALADMIEFNGGQPLRCHA